MEVLNTIALLVKLLDSFRIQATNVYVKMDITMMESILSAQVIIKFYN
jgi:hypothetical protein